ncbi:hypothetical protein FOCC_FOCC017304, partial [Frankliniella occidentalis]
MQVSQSASLQFLTALLSLGLQCRLMFFRLSAGMMWSRPQSGNSHRESMMMSEARRQVSVTACPLERLRLICLSRGASGIMGLGSKALNWDEFSRGMKDAGLDLDADHLRELFDMFDKDKSGSVSLNEFLLQI